MVWYANKLVLHKSTVILVLSGTRCSCDSGSAKKEYPWMSAFINHVQYMIAYSNDILAFFANAITSLVRISPSFFSTFNLPILSNRRIISSSPK
jgi:hypothetical protein